MTLYCILFAIVVFRITSYCWVQIYTRRRAESSLLNCKPVQEHSYCCFKAVVDGPAGRRAPDHFFGRVCFPPFSCFGSFFLALNSDFEFIDAIIIDRPSQGVKTLKNNAQTMQLLQWQLSYLWAVFWEKTWRNCIQRLKALTSLHIRAVWSVPLLFALLKV